MAYMVGFRDDAKISNAFVNKYYKLRILVSCDQNKIKCVLKNIKNVALIYISIYIIFDIYVMM